MFVFDVTTLYFESFRPDEIRQFCIVRTASSRRLRWYWVFALVTNIEGHPLSYELFPGNTNEGKDFNFSGGEDEEGF